MLNYILMLIKISAVVGVTILRRSQHPRLSKCPPRVASAVSRIISGTEFIIPPPPMMMIVMMIIISGTEFKKNNFFPVIFNQFWVQQAVASDFDHKRVVRRSLLLAVNLGALVVYFQLSSFCPRHVKHKYENTEDQSKQLVIMIAVALFIENILLHSNVTLIMKQYGVA